MAVKVIKESKMSKELNESFDFDEFKRKARKIESMVTDLTMDLEDAIDEDIYDKEHGVQGPTNLSPGIADKVCDELQNICGTCELMIKVLIEEYNL